MSSTKLYYNNINLHNVGSRLDVAIQNRIKNGQALSDYNRQVKLEIPQPPAQFKSTEEANLDASFQNTKAIANLSTFMYYNDATNALSDLIKNNEVVEFNNFYEQFKKAIGSRFLSYYEFIAFWDKFKENLTNVKSDILTLEPEKKQIELIKNKNKNVIKSLKEKVSPRLALTNHRFKKSEIEDMDIDNLRILAKEENIKFPSALKNKEKLLKLIYADPNLRDKIDMGAGLHHFTMRGSGISSKHSLEHRYSILKGEINAGNNNPILHKELKEIKKKLY